MKVTTTGKPTGDDSSRIKRWQSKRAEELSRDPALRADFEEEKRRADAGLPSTGGRGHTQDELRRLALGEDL